MVGPLRAEFVAVDFVNASDFEPAKEQSMEQLIQARLNERVANLTLPMSSQNGFRIAFQRRVLRTFKV